LFQACGTASSMQEKFEDDPDAFGKHVSLEMTSLGDKSKIADVDADPEAQEGDNVYGTIFRSYGTYSKNTKKMLAEVQKTFDEIRDKEQKIVDQSQDFREKLIKSFTDTVEKFLSDIDVTVLRVKNGVLDVYEKTLTQRMEYFSEKKLKQIRKFVKNSNEQVKEWFDGNVEKVVAQVKREIDNYVNKGALKPIDTFIGKIEKDLENGTQTMINKNDLDSFVTNIIIGFNESIKDTNGEGKMKLLQSLKESSENLDFETFGSPTSRAIDMLKNFKASFLDRIETQGNRVESYVVKANERFQDSILSYQKKVKSILLEQLSYTSENFTIETKNTVKQVKEFMENISSEVEETIEKEIVKFDESLTHVADDFTKIAKAAMNDLEDLFARMRKNSMEKLESMGDSVQRVREKLSNHFVELERKFSNVVNKLGDSAQKVIDKAKKAGERIEEGLDKAADVVAKIAAVTNTIAKIPGVGDNAATLTLALIFLISVVFGFILLADFIDIPTIRKGVVARICIQQDQYQVVVALFVGLQVILPVAISILTGDDEEETTNKTSTTTNEEKKTV